MHYFLPASLIAIGDGPTILPRGTLNPPTSVHLAKQVQDMKAPHSDPSHQDDMVQVISLQQVKWTIANLMNRVATLQQMKQVIANRVDSPYLPQIKWTVANGAVDTLSLWDITMSIDLLMNAHSFKQAIVLPP